MSERSLVLSAAVAAFLCFTPAAAEASAEWNTKIGTYEEDLQDLADIDKLQAVQLVGGANAVQVAPNWRIHQPAVPPADMGSELPFDSVGSATQFAAITEKGLYGEQVQLYQRWFGAVRDMLWDDECPPGKRVENLTECFIFPVSDPLETALGAKEDQVLLCPDVRTFNDCHYWDTPEQAKSCPGVPQGNQGKPDLVTLFMHKSKYRSIMRAGFFFNATWWIRSPGMHENPAFKSGAPSSDFNRRVVGMRVALSYTTDGGIFVTNNYLGGATGESMQPDLAQGCLKVSTGCPVRVGLHGPPTPTQEKHFINVAKPYLPDDPVKGKPVYTPYSMSFCLGRMFSHSPMMCNRCSDSFMGFPLSHYSLCDKDPPGGVLGFFLTTWGRTGKTLNLNDVDCPTSEGVSCANCRASASIYIDGMMLTAGEGEYLSPLFDSLSEYTEWTALRWGAEVNRDLGDNPLFRIRTPITFTWSVSGIPAALSSTLVVASGQVVPADPEDGFQPLAGTPDGRYMRYHARLVSWSENPAYSPVGTGTQYVETCLRHGLEYDGSLSPTLYHVSVEYEPHAGMLISKPIKPPNLKRWTVLTYGADTSGGGTVRVDVLAENLSPAVMEDGTVLADVPTGISLSRLDPGKYPSVRIRITLDRGALLANDPRVEWFRLEYEPMKEALAVSCNALNLSRGESCDVRFMSKAAGMVDVKVHDTAGQLVVHLFHGEVSANEIYQRTWDGTGRDGLPVAPGVYFVTAVTPASRQTVRLAVMR